MPIHAAQRTARQRLAVLEVPMVGALEPRDRIVVASEHEGARREELEIRRLERCLPSTLVRRSCASSQARLA